MKPYFILSLTAIVAIISSCTGNNKTTAKETDSLANNPLLTASTLPYRVPPFDKIKDANFEPALKEGMKQQLAEIQKIADNPDTPTFNNTLVAIEKSGELFTRANRIFNLLTSANTDSALQKVQEKVAPEMAAHQDAIYLNSKLFKRVKAIYDTRSSLKLNPESDRLIEFYYQQFVKAGANLSDDDKAKLKKLNEQEASLSAQFNNKLLAAAKTGGVIITDSTHLMGLSPGEKAALAQNAKANKEDNKWLIPLQNTTQQPLLQSLADRDTRQKLFNASWNRAEKSDSNDTRKTIVQIAQLRAQKAKLLGFPNYAAWNLQDQMAKTPQTVDQFFAKLIPASVAEAKKEGADIQTLIDKQKGGFKLQPYDWNYYSEQVCKQKFDLDESQVKPYFEINKVLQDGVFYAANQLYGLTFKERHDLPVYQKDVRVFNVIDKDGKQLGLFYCDYFKRDNKNGGAWMDYMVGQSKLLGTKPVIYNVCNFTKPAPGQPALISFDDVTTMFHEFGHGLHGLFADQEYPSLSGTNVARDFVEFPSQFNEHWASYPSVFRHYAVHYKTGQPMPQLLVDKIKQAATFNQGYLLTEIIAAASLDMQWHELSADAPLQDADKFELAALTKTGLNLPDVPPRYRSSYFLHIWANDYAAGYYAYLWTEMLDDDAYVWFIQNGGLTRANGQRFRDMILSRGNTIEYGKMYRDFAGHDPQIKPMEEKRGLIN